MPSRWETILARWQSAGLIDAATAERIRAFESRQGDSQRLRWPTILAITIGGLMLGAGVLLFVGFPLSCFLWACFTSQARSLKRNFQL